MIGGSGGGLGNGGEAGAGGGAIEFIVEGKATIQSGVIAMNGGTVFVNPSIGANFQAGAGSGGAVRIVAEEIENLGFIEVRGVMLPALIQESQAQGISAMPGVPVGVDESLYLPTELLARV